MNMIKKLMYSTFFILIFLGLGISAFSNSNYIIYGKSSPTIYVVNLSSQTIVTTRNLGYNPVDISTSKDGYMVTVSDEGTTRRIRTYDSGFNLINDFQVTEATNFAIHSCYRVNSSVMFCAVDQTVGGALEHPVIEYDSLGNEIKRVNVTQTLGTGNMKIWDFANTSGGRYLFIGLQGSFVLGSNITLYRAWDIDTATWKSYANYTFTGSPMMNNSFLLYDNVNSRVYIADNWNSSSGDIRNIIYVYNLDSSLTNTSLAWTKSILNNTHWIISRDAKSYIRLNSSGGISEDGGTLKHTALPSGTYTQIIEWINVSITVGGEEQQTGITFNSFEYSAGCNLKQPIGGTYCSIGGKSCNTSNPNITQQTFQQPLTYTNLRTYIPSTGYSPYFETKNNKSNWVRYYGFPAMTKDQGGIWSYESGWEINYTIPINLYDVNTSQDLTRFTDYGTGSIGIDPYINCSAFDSNLIYSGRISIYLAINESHYDNATMLCVGQVGGYSTGFNPVTHTDLFGNSTPVGSLIEFDYINNMINRRGRVYFEVNRSNFPLPSGIVRYPFENSHYIEANHTVRFQYLNMTSAKCNIGNLTTGNYIYSCVAPNGYLFHDNAQNVINKNITFYGTSYTIDVPLISDEDINIMLNITYNINPIINAMCGIYDPLNATSYTDPNGICMFYNVLPNTLYGININPNMGGLGNFSTWVQTGDTYNSQQYGENGGTNFCRNFDSYYYYGFDFSDLDVTVTFIVQDTTAPQNDQGVYDTFITVDNNYVCTTNQIGVCSVNIPKSYRIVNFTADHFPQYNVYYSRLIPDKDKEINVLLVANSSDSTQNRQNSMRGGGWLAGSIEAYENLAMAFISPMGIALMFCIALAGGLAYWTGSGIMGGIGFISGFMFMSFLGLFPMWMVIVIIILSAFVIAWFSGIVGG